MAILPSGLLIELFAEVISLYASKSKIAKDCKDSSLRFYFFGRLYFAGAVHNYKGLGN